MLRMLSVNGLVHNPNYLHCFMPSRVYPKEYMGEPYNTIRYRAIALIALHLLYRTTQRDGSTSITIHLENVISQNTLTRLSHLTDDLAIYANFISKYRTVVQNAILRMKANMIFYTRRL